MIDRNRKYRDGNTADSSGPTRYGTISDTIIMVRTTQIQHAFREILELTAKFREKRLSKSH